MVSGINLTAVWKERKCYICGKEFLITPEWVYKRGETTGIKVFCSWKCLQAYNNRKRIRPAERREAILKLMESEHGITNTELAARLGVDARTIYYDKQQLKKDGAL